MEKFPWWNEAQIELAEDAKRFTDEVLIPIGERDALKKRFSWEGVKQMASKGWFGALIPKKYGGHAEEWGVTGAAIILEETSRAAELGGPLGPRCTAAPPRSSTTATKSKNRSGCPG